MFTEYFLDKYSSWYWPLFTICCQSGSNLFRAGANWCIFKVWSNFIFFCLFYISNYPLRYSILRPYHVVCRYPGFSKLKIQKKNGLPVAFVDFKVLYHQSEHKWFTQPNGFWCRLSLFFFLFYNFLSKWIRKLVFLLIMSLCGLSFRVLNPCQRKQLLNSLIVYQVDLINLLAGKEQGNTLAAKVSMIL